MDAKKIERILLITLTNVGDAVLTLPVLDILYKRFPDARIDILAGPGVVSIFERDKRAAKIFIYNKRSKLFEQYRLLKKLFKMRYDLVVDLKNTLFPFLLMPKYRTQALRGHKDGIHKKDEHLGRLKDIDINTDGAVFGMQYGDDDKSEVIQMFGSENALGNFIVINPGAKSYLKRWPAEFFARLADEIKTKLKIGVVIIGTDNGTRNPDNDRVVADKILSLSKTRPVDLVGKTNIRQLAYIISRCKALVTNDSGPMHIASAMNTPTVAIFGPTDSVKYGPLADKHIVVRGKSDCSPCEKAECSRSFDCLKNITVDSVLQALKEICGY